MDLDDLLALVDDLEDDPSVGDFVDDLLGDLDLLLDVDEVMTFPIDLLFVIASDRLVFGLVPSKLKSRSRKDISRMD